jgi:hypothetical protein
LRLFLEHFDSFLKIEGRFAQFFFFRRGMVRPENAGAKCAWARPPFFGFFAFLHFATGSKTRLPMKAKT